ncbi:MAG: polyprenyl synthetase family protein [Acidobacteria bacterium]|nr:polyprenyl synthetase family protein [Acidobacteriota bacterium]
MLDLIRPDLAQVEEEFVRQAESEVALVAEIVRYLQQSGGKRLRPALHLLAAKFCGYEGPSAVKLGAVLELIHTATLIHDDIIDGASTRRGRPSTNRRWGSPMSVLAGDWLYMQAFRTALAEHNFRILDILIELTQTMVEGELLQLSYLGRADITEREALDIAYRKTACLFSVCAQLGAVLGGKSREDEERLAAYGLNAGLAFQVIDDLLDITASPERLGKPVVSDLREGKVTLPLLYALDAAGDAGRNKVDTVLREKGFRSTRPEEIVDLVKDSGAVERTHAKALTLAEAALGHLNGFPDSVYKRALEALPTFILQRDY